MRVFILTVNYNSEKELYDYINSIKDSFKRIDDLIIDLIIFDNSEKDNFNYESFKENFENLSLTNFSIKTYRSSLNSGYFGGISLMRKNVLKKNYDFAIYCNPDILLDVDFFSSLNKIDSNDKGIIAPSIITVKEGFDQNPMYLERLKKKKLIRLKLIFNNNITYNIYSAFSYLIKELSFKKKKPFLKSKIYAVHGSIFIFSNLDFVKKIPDYPCFLFGEEIFIAEEARLNGIEIFYKPEVIVNDIRHASVGKQSSNFRRKHNYNSIVFLLDKYYN
jgi:GT2 family glycosyltransferase